MLRLLFLLTGSALVSLVLVSCGKDPAAQYRLSAEQLAWQGYELGQVLRFGHAKDGRVRTYRVTEIRDVMEKQYGGINWTPFPSKEPPLCQHVTVLAQRTDSLFQPRPVLDLELYAQGGDPVQLRAEAEWETFYYARLPLNEVIKGLPIDTLEYQYPGTALLPMVRLGPANYTQVVRVNNRRGMVSLPKQTRRLYYARGKGVVAFEEAGNDLWYRLP